MSNDMDRHELFLAGWRPDVQPEGRYSSQGENDQCPEKELSGILGLIIPDISDVIKCKVTWTSDRCNMVGER